MNLLNLNIRLHHIVFVSFYKSSNPLKDELYSDSIIGKRDLGLLFGVISKNTNTRPLVANCFISTCQCYLSVSL